MFSLFSTFLSTPISISEQMASNLESIPGDPDTKKAVLITRRCIILTLVASTPTENTTLDLILQNGYLSEVKLWMDDILKGFVGEFFPSMFDNRTVAYIHSIFLVCSLCRLSNNDLKITSCCLFRITLL